jgi:hypothetical protein
VMLAAQNLQLPHLCFSILGGIDLCSPSYNHMNLFLGLLQDPLHIDAKSGLTITHGAD